MNVKPATIKVNWKSSPKLITSTEHSVKGYADDVTLISNEFGTHVSVLQAVDQRAGDLDLSFKPQKCVSYMFDGSKHLQKGIPLSKGTTHSITEGGTKLLGKLIDVSLSATKKAANKRMNTRLSQLLTVADALSICGEYKLWIYQNYIPSLLRFHLCVDAVLPSAISKNGFYCYLLLEEMAKIPTKLYLCCTLLSRNLLPQCILYIQRSKI